MILHTAIFLGETDFLQSVDPVNRDLGTVIHIRFLLHQIEVTAVLHAIGIRQRLAPSRNALSIWVLVVTSFVVALRSLFETATFEPLLKRTGMPLYLRTRILRHMAHSPLNSG